MNIISRDQARSLGSMWYYTGVACIHGHVGKRRVSDYSCYECGQRERNFLPRGRITHGSCTGRNKTPEYGVWAAMKSRCKVPEHKSYPNYGGRGIRVCKRWNRFENFLADMGLRPSPKHQLDRINNNAGYEPLNCRWATKFEQARNTRRNRMITGLGQTLTAVEWSQKLNVHYDAIMSRLRSGKQGAPALAPARRRAKKIMIANLGKVMSVADWAKRLKISYSTIYRRFTNGEGPAQSLRPLYSRRQT